MNDEFLINLVNSFIPDDGKLNYLNKVPYKPYIITDDFSCSKSNKIFCSYTLKDDIYILILDWHINEWYVKETIKININNDFNRNLTSKIVVSECSGDIDGDGIIDKVYLFGFAPFNNTKNYISDMTMVIEYGNKKTDTIYFKNNSGYNPKVNLYSFVSKKKKEIFISIIPGGSDNSIFYYIYSFIDGSIKNIFDFEAYNKDSSKIYSVLYMPNYNVQIVNSSLKKQYLINLSLNDKEYLSFLYKDDGTLRDNFKGSISNLVGLYPINLENDDIFQLLAVQDVVGIATKDILGSIQVSLYFKDDSFNPSNEVVSIDGFYKK